jgi:hypothetical protein
MKTTQWLVAALGVELVAAGAQAQGPSHLKLHLREVGGDVVATTSGGIDASAFSLQQAGAGPFYGAMQSGGGNSWFVTTGSGIYDYYYGTMSLTSGTGSPFSGPSSSIASGNTGNFFGLGQFSPGYFEIGIPIGHSGGAPFTNSSTWAGATLSSLGLAAGKNVWGYGPNNANTITVQVGGSAVPEPGEWAAMGILGAGLTGLVLRKRRKG